MKSFRKLVTALSAVVLYGGSLAATAQQPPVPPADPQGALPPPYAGQQVPLAPGYQPPAGQQQQQPAANGGWQQPEQVSSNWAYPLTGYFPPIPYQSSSDYPTAGAFDAVGTDDPRYPKPAGRPMYPYGKPYWEAQDSDAEAYGDLLELNNVTPGWFGHFDVSYMKPHLNSSLTSDTTLDAIFPGNPVTLGAADFDMGLLGKLTIGKRWEHGLGEVQVGAKTFNFDGSETLLAFDPGGPATLNSVIRGNTIDLDFCALEFNAEGLPLIPPMFKNPGRLGLAKPLTPGYLMPPLEIRWLFGFRYANIFYDTQAIGPTLTERITSNTWGAGLHFMFELNQRIPVETPLFAHFRLEGSGVYGTTTQTYFRDDAGLAATGTYKGNLGWPNADIEVGVSWVPNWPMRDMRVTCAYHFEEWFTFADTGVGNAYLTMHGMLLRSEFRF